MATATLVAPTKIRIKLPPGLKLKKAKGALDAQAVRQDESAKFVEESRDAWFEGLDLWSAVEAFQKQGIAGLDNSVLLSPWREPSPEAMDVDEQWQAAAEPTAGCKRTAAGAAAAAAGKGEDSQQDSETPSWASKKRRKLQGSGPASSVGVVKTLGATGDRPMPDAQAEALPVKQQQQEGVVENGKQQRAHENGKQQQQVPENGKLQASRHHKQSEQGVELTGSAHQQQQEAGQGKQLQSALQQPEKQQQQQGKGKALSTSGPANGTSKLVITLKQLGGGGPGAPSRPGSQGSQGASKGNSSSGQPPAVAAVGPRQPKAARVSQGGQSERQQQQQQEQQEGKRPAVAKPPVMPAQQGQMKRQQQTRQQQQPHRESPQQQQQAAKPAVDRHSKGWPDGSNQRQAGKAGQGAAPKTDRPAPAAAPAAPAVGQELAVVGPEVSAASRDTAAAAAAAVAASGGALAAVGGNVGGGAGPFTLLDLPSASLTAAAAALEEVVLECSDREAAEEVDATPEAGEEKLRRVLDEARTLKKRGDKRYEDNRRQWDVFGLCLYALSVVRYMEYMDYAATLYAYHQRQGNVGGLRPPNHANIAPIYSQCSQMCSMAIGSVSNAIGPDVAKRVLWMLLERLMVITSMRHLTNTSRSLQDNVRRVRAAAAATASGNCTLPQQQQQMAAVGPSAGRGGLTAGVGPSAALMAGANAALGEQHQGAGKKCSPDHSLGSGQDSMTVLKLPSGAQEAGRGGAGPAGAFSQADVLMADQQLQRSLAHMLQVTEGIHRNVMRVQQFLESPDVMCNLAAKQAALEVSVLGMDGGMCSMPQVARHTRAAVAQIMKILRS